MTVAEFDPRQREIDLFLSEGRAPAAPNSREADLAAFLELGAGPPATGAPVASAGPPPAPPFEPAKRPEAVALHSWATIAEAAGRGMTAAEQAQTDPDRPLVKEVIARFARGSTGEPTVQAGAGIQMAGSQLERISALAEFGQAIVDTGKIVEAFGKAEQAQIPRSDAEFFLGVIPTPRTAAGAIAEATPQLIAQVGAAMTLGPAASLPAKLAVFSGTAVGPAVGSQFAEARDYHLANGASEQEAQNRATLEAGIAGTITAATNLVPGIAILRKTPGGNKAVTGAARAIATRWMKRGAAESFQEVSEQILTDSAASVQRKDPTLWKKIVEFDPEYWGGLVTAGLAGWFLGGFAGVGVDIAQDKQGPKPPPAEARIAALELAVTGVPRPARQTAAELGTREGATKLATEQPAVAAKIAAKPTPSRDDMAGALAPGEKMSGKQRRALADLLRTEIIAEVEQTQLETTTRGRTTEGGVPRPTVILSRKAQAVINSMPEIDATGEPPTVKQVAKITGSNMQQARRVRGQIIKHLEARAKEAQRAREVPRAEEVVPEEAPRRQPVEGQGVRREGVQRPEDAGFEPGRPAPAPEEPEEELIRTRPAPGRPRTKAVRVLEETSTLDLVTMAGSAVDTTREDIRITPEEARIELERRRAGAANRAVAAGETADEAPAAPEPTTAPKVGDSQSVMGLDSVVEAVEEVDGVRFELYGDAAPETGGTIRAVDVDSGEPIGMTHYRTAVEAAARFGETIDSARRRGQPADEVAEPTEEEPEEPPSPTEEPTGPTRGPAPTLAPALKTNELGDAPLSAKLIRAAGVTLGKTTKARKLFRVMTEGSAAREPGTFSQFQQRARWKNHETLRQPLFLLRKKGLARVIGFNEQGKPIYALGTGTRQAQSEIDALAAASTVGMEPALAQLEEDQKRRGKQARPAATRPEEETRTPPAEEAKRATGPPKPVVRARLQDVVSKASSELGGDFVEQINQLLEASEDTRAGDAEGHFSIRPEDLEDLSPTLRAAVIKRYSVDEDGGEAVLDVVGQTLYDAAVSEAMMSVGASTDATLDWVIWHAEHLMPEASMSAFLIQAIERSQPGKGPEGRLDPKLYIRVDDLPLGTTFTIFGQEIVVSSEEDVGDVLDAGRVQWPRAAFDEFPIDIGSLRLPPDGGTPAPAAPEPTAPAEKVVREKAFADEIEESTNDFLGASAERLRENYILNNRGLQETGKALSKETDYQDAVQANLRRMGFPNQIVVFRGRHKDRPPPSGEFVNVSFREGVAENFRKATLPEPPPSSKWVVERFVVPRDKVVGVGSAAESELIVRLSDLKAETGIQGRKGVATPAPSAVPARTAKGPSPAKIAAVEKKAPPKWCKDCSTVVIRTITGENVPEPGKGRSFAETVVAVEDAGFKPDYAPTRTWRGKPVRDLGRDAHTDITGFVAVEGHVMPIVDGRISNISGHGNEAITAVVAFRRAAAKPEAGKPPAAEPLKAPPVPISQPGLLGEEFGGGITSTQEGLAFTQPSQLESEVEAEAKARTKRDKDDETMNLLPDPKGADPRTSTSRRHRGFISSDIFMLPVKAAQVIGFPLDAVLHLEAMDLIDNVERFGGAEGKRIGEIARETVNRTKTISGRLSHARVRAIRKTNQANLKKGAAWKLQAVDWGRGRRYGMSRFVEALEGRIADEDMTAGELTIIKEMRKLTVATGESLEDVKLLQRSRGQGLKELFGVGEKLFTKTPSGKKFVRLPTYEYYDLLMRGPKAAAFKVLVKAIAEMNEKSTAQVEEVFQQMRADMVAAGDPAFRRIGPEFAREWKRFPTHIRVKGEASINLLRTNPTGYATQLVSSTAHRAAFVAVIGQDATDIEKLRAAYGKAGGNVHLLDSLFRALNNVPPFMRNAINPPPSPGSAPYLFARFINGIVNLHASAALSAAVIPNLGEPLGNVGPFFGYKRMAQAFIDSMPYNPARKQALRTLERAGAITLDIMEFTIDRDRWVSSMATQLGQVVSRASFLKFINEGQEQLGGFAALRMLADFKAGRGTVEDEHLLRLLKFDKEARKALVTGISNQRLSDDFLQRATRFTTGSTATKAETGPLRNRRDFNFFIKFTGYFANTARQFKTHVDEIDAAMKTSDTARKRVAWKKMSKFLFGKAYSGVMANFMWAFFLGGPAGVREKWEELRQNPIDFFFQSFIYSVFGGLMGTLLNMGKAESPDDLLRAISRGAFPVSLGIDYWTMWRGDGPYKNMTRGEKAVRFTQLHTPALRTMPYKALGGVLGMAYMDPKLDVAKRRYWSWRFERSNNARPPNYRSYQDAVGSQRQFKIHMRRAYDAMVKGEDTTPHLLAAFELEGKGFKNIKASLLGRRLLVAREGSITQAQLDKMKSEMTTESWEMLEAHDLLLSETANKFTLAVARGEIQTK